MKNNESLALFGGPPAVNIPPPHFTWPIIGEDEIRAVTDQLNTSQVSYYRCDGIIDEFEQAFARYHNRPYVISTCSGTAAIHAAFFSLNLPVGTEVIAPAYTHLGTVFPMLHVGLIPVLCDIDEATGNIDSAQVEERITKDTGAIIVTHQYGHICDMDRILKIARQHGLYVIEDCSHAHGASLNGQLAGTFGDIACFSLQSHKSVWGGEGGILLTDQAQLADRAALFAHFRQEREFTAAESSAFVESGYGLKNRLHPLAAALAITQLKKLPATMQSRAEHYKFFVQQLRDVSGLTPLTDNPGIDRGGFFRFVFRYNAPALGGLPVERYMEALKAEGVASLTPGAMAKPVHLFNFFRQADNGFYPIFFKSLIKEKADKLLYKHGDFPRAEHFSRSTLQFPAFTAPSFDIITQYVQAMHKVQSHLAALEEMPA